MAERLSFRGEPDLDGGKREVWLLENSASCPKNGPNWRQYGLYKNETLARASPKIHSRRASSRYEDRAADIAPSSEDAENVAR
jgi:hypothetical protein